MPLRFKAAANGSFKDRLRSSPHSARATARPDLYCVGTRSCIADLESAGATAADDRLGVYRALRRLQTGDTAA
jgi:hypothetical protein